jgi:hypothetical protein
VTPGGSGASPLLLAGGLLARFFCVICPLGIRDSQQ